MRKLSILFFSITILSFSVLIANAEDNATKLLDVSEKLSNIKKPVEGLSKELDMFNNQTAGIDLKFKFDYFFQIVEKLFEEQKSNLDKEEAENKDYEFEELQKNLDGLELLIDCWHTACLKLRALNFYLISQNKKVSDLEWLDIKINIFKHLYEDMEKNQELSDKNKYVTNIVRSCLPGKLYSAWFKYRDSCYKLVEIDLEKEKKYFETYKKCIAVINNPKENDLKSLWFKLEEQKGDTQKQIDDAELEKNEIKNLKLIQVVFNVLQVQLIKAKQELLNPVGKLEQDDKDKDSLIRVKFEGIESELVVEIIKKLLATASPLNILKVLIFGGWERIASSVPFVN